MHRRPSPSRTGRAVFAASVVLALVGAGPVQAGAHSSGPATAAWGACPTDVAQSYPWLVCTTVTVPLNYARPNGQQLTIGVAKAPARDPAHRRGALVVTNGGPGGEWMARAGTLTKPDSSGTTRIPPAVLDAYDIVGFDVRGLAHSSALHCVPPQFWAAPRPDFDSPADRDTLWRQQGQLGAACGQQAGGLLPYLGTGDVARDLDRVRAALGETKISYLGMGYGTYLASVYTQLFPGRTDKLIFDGTDDTIPADYFYQRNLAFVPGYYQRREEFFDWAARYGTVFGLGTTGADVRRVWDSIAADLRRAPHGSVGPSEFITATLGILVGENLWTPFAQAMADYVRGDDAGLVAFATPDVSAASENAMALTAAVECVDSPSPKDQATWERDFGAAQAGAPFIGWYAMWLTASCQSWPVSGRGRLAPDGSVLPPTLMVANVDDPSAPYAGQVRMHQAYPSSVLVSVTSGKFGEVFNRVDEVNPAVNRIATDYLLNGTLPARDVTVPGHALPDPTLRG
jgi:pimeloyl-ACP methyl ester carboxylesterase